jgi:hypothetical protein
MSDKMCVESNNLIIDEILFRQDINNNEAYFAFETFVFNVLSDYVKNQGKTIEKYDYDNNLFDAFLPEGIDDSSLPTYVEVKYSRANKNSYFKSVEKICLDASERNIKQILIILGTKLSPSSKESMLNLACLRIKAKVIIWDFEDLCLKTKQYFDKYYEYIRQPKKAIVEKAISSTDRTSDEKNKEKEMLLSKLKMKYQDEDVVLFLGAGVSIDAQIPLWNDLIYKLLIEMINSKLEMKGKQLDERQLNLLVNLAYKNKEESPLTQMRYIRAAFEPHEYNKLIHKILYEKNPKPNTDLLKSIAQICTPRRNHIGVKGIITYNFDDLVERCLKAKDIHYCTIYKETDRPFNDRLSIYHVHGYMPKNMQDISGNECNIVFSEEDYHKVYRDAYCWSNIAQLNYLRENTCVFIGCSLTDPNVRRLLDVAARNGEEPRHFAIMKKESIFNDNEINEKLDNKIVELYKNIDDSIRESFFATLGLNIIWVRDYNEIPEILKWLSL